MYWNNKDKNNQHRNIYIVKISCDLESLMGVLKEHQISSGTLFVSVRKAKLLAADC